MLYCCFLASDPKMSDYIWSRRDAALQDGSKRQREVVEPVEGRRAEVLRRLSSPPNRSHS